MFKPNCSAFSFSCVTKCFNFSPEVNKKYTVRRLTLPLASRFCIRQGGEVRQGCQFLSIVQCQQYLINF